MFGFAGIVVPTAVGAPGSLDLPDRVECRGFCFQYRLLASSEFQHESRHCFPNGDVMLLLGVSYEDVDRFDSFEAFERDIDGAFTAIGITADGVRVYRDPVGWRSVYYRSQGGVVYLASNIRYFKEVLGLTIEPTPGRVVDFLCTSFIPGAVTLTRDVCELPMGHVLEVCESGEVTVRDYCRYHELEKQSVTEADAAEALYSICRANMERIQRATGNDRCTVFLSGGLDSTCALSLALDVFGPEGTQAISVHFGADLPNENEFVDEAVRYFGCRHRYLKIDPGSFLDEMPSIYRWVDDPIGDPVVMPNYLMNRATANEARLVITGEGGDPCFGGPKNVFMTTTMAYRNLFADSTERDFLVRAYLESFRRAFDEVSELCGLPPGRYSEQMEALIDRLFPYLHAPQWSDFLDRLLFANKYLKCNSLILPKVQKTTQPFARYSLSPLYSRRVVEFCAQTPVSIKYPELREKHILKQAFRERIPQSIIDREKSGMRVPLRFWQERRVRAFNRRVLLSRRRRAFVSQFFNLDHVREILRNPRPRQGLKAWMLTSFVLTASNLYESHD